MSELPPPPPPPYVPPSPQPYVPPPYVPPPPAAPPPAQEPATGAPDRPGTVTGAAVLVFVQAGLAVLGTVLLVLLLLFIGVLASGGSYGSTRGVLLIIAVVGGLIGIGIVVLLVFLGMKLLRLRNWARITTIILNGLGVLSYLGGMGYVASTRRGVGGTAAQGFVSFALEVAIIVLLLTPSANRAFAAARKRIA